MNPRQLLPLLQKTIEEWVDDRAPSPAASLTYFTLFSIAPILIIAIAVAGLLFGARGVFAQLQGSLNQGPKTHRRRTDVLRGVTGCAGSLQ